MAQAFSTALDSAFSLDSEVDDLSNSIDQKWVLNLATRFSGLTNNPINRRYQMMIQSRELEELQARIRAAEQRLKSRQSVQLGSHDTHPEKIEEESQETSERFPIG